ncbi:TIMELESS-interacting protein-like [Dendronephthya gigantea]|uniref:TIMELESS-interacting protein-like n=1 Tax=Dendronephthya gigantea TaxID=151771 RepID=UPI00106DAD09|nr:TIMELESS-interacting protein-like [Dendronephthya gigantea]
MEVYGNDVVLGDAEDLFAIPPPLDESLLVDDPANIAAHDDAENQNIDGDPTQENDGKKKKKRAFKPRVNLNDERLCSKNGIQALKHLCSEENFKGKGHEVSDLNKLLCRFEHWAQCLMPRWPFNNVVQKCELLGSKSKVKNELKRIRQSEEEVIRGEPDEEGNEETEGQAETIDEERPTEAMTQPDTVQDEAPPAELTEEQREKIRQNRLLAFERREAKRRRLEEESQRESQIEGLTEAEEAMLQEDFSEELNSVEPESSLSTYENAEEDQILEDELPDEIRGSEDTTTNINKNDGENDVNDEASVVQDVDDNSESHIALERKEFCSQSNTETELNDNEMSDGDDEIINRSMFDLNPDLNSDTNSEPTINSGDKEVLFNDSQPNRIVNEPDGS